MHKETNLTSLKDTIDQLNREAWKIRVNDSNRSHVLSNEALNLANDINYTRGRADGLRTSAFCLMRLSKNTEAKVLSEEALQLYKELNDDAGEGYIYCGLGIIQRNLSDYKASLELLFKSLELIKQTNFREVEPLVYYHIGITHKYMGNLEQALEYLLTSLSGAREINDWIAESYTLNMLGTIYDELGDYDHALEYHNHSLLIRKKSGDKWGEAGSLNNIGNIFLKQGDYPKALEFCGQSLVMARSVGDKKGEANSLFHLARIHAVQNDHLDALATAKQSLEIRKEIGDKKGLAEVYLFLSGISSPDIHQKGGAAAQLEMLSKALSLGEETGAQDMLLKIHHRFYKLFKQQSLYEKALEHLELSDAIEKEMHSQAFNQKILNLEITHKIEQSKKEAEIYRLRNVELADLYEESNRQRQEIQITLTELKLTQTQLIQKEKMASLGELTAGIAHEIQNPLNFVNNFSEINKEMLEELRTESLKPKAERNEQAAAEIIENVIANEEKIIHHGKRADAIVKGMLQHSRKSEVSKEPTDINKLCDEYLRLAYHGLRAKDKSFNADFKTEFDDSMGKINIVPQDIGRVMLNLINNAFYAVAEKQKTATADYQPTVSISTKKNGNTIELMISDNGNGIPHNIVEKIFQPFFTTKPTGQGTGLGLSLAYDIIKAHGGELKVETLPAEAAAQQGKDGTGASFIVYLPMI